MGLVRILLAICVFSGHSKPLGGLPWLRSDSAVELFFVISGFYMQLVLSSRYTPETLGKSWTFQFYKARYLRLMPIYLAASALVMVLALLRNPQPPLSVWSDIAALPGSVANLLFKVFFVLTNISMMFQDVIMFLSVRGAQVQWSTNFWHSEIALWQGLMIPQAWSLGVELSFYVIAPFLLNLRARWLVAGVMLCLMCKFTAVEVSELSDPWTYRFFPFELGYFLLGALAFRNRNRMDGFISERAGKYLVYPLACGFIMFAVPVLLPNLVYPLILAGALPFIFKVSCTWRLDRYIGELSYPFYIFHFLALSVAKSFNGHFLGGSDDVSVWLGFGLTWMLSAVSLAMEERFIEPWRTPSVGPHAFGESLAVEEAPG